MYFDSHAHYDDAAFDEDRDAVLSALADAGVDTVVNPGCTVASSRSALALAERYPFVYAAVGIHPENCGGAGEADFAAIAAMADHPKCVAIGEIGLDYYWPENPPRDFQRRVLHRQMELAREKNLPVIIHDRDAHGDCMDAVRAAPDVRGVFHCYSGSLEDAKVLIDRGWYLGFNGAVTFKNARKAPEVAAWMPADRLLIETDCPYLAPVPHRGKRNDSGYLPDIVRFLAQIRTTTAEDIARLSAENARRLFGLAK